MEIGILLLLNGIFLAVVFFVLLMVLALKSGNEKEHPRKVKKELGEIKAQINGEESII